MISQFTHRLRPRYAAMLLLLGAGLGLGGCAGMGDGIISGAFVDPARYDSYDCKQMEGERASLIARTAEQQRLIDKAATGVAGGLVGTVAYRNDYISARAQSKLLEENWVRSKCVASPPAAEPPASAPARSHRHRG